MQFGVGACLACGARIGPADACSPFSVHWEFKFLAAEVGHPACAHGVTDGIDHVTAVVEDGEWKLCRSHFSSRERPVRSTLTSNRCPTTKD
ncbi:MAG TPA: hypothetical protein VM032_18255 [Vicinamibacterales bacterium]|nr:hypothetical protein [Vicinamibacterales bacterium]